ncbi:MarR family winged helix-turn-helix transcriptional regulator [Limosilactobacillus reuteri]|uniref:MarR family transcriptional regulator n=1 Tax=Limosilactobacillus reuteri TaxID=1598 RepID=A0A347TAI0_LIMRT|nr:MarR family winged helix-turn-helix transcriptional regulator [Limosilactobacillus reuteri]AXX74929.1 MarR family transcriptional regulator [Limosilactobacillus reuteri]MRG69963.1 MarR family transcriptional regulator [Limosilactobacillus reuteri]MRI04388.1 MarR family transcriptional regulator [Limosilactobacillus reuteri]WLR79344.1 MarR family winged helix-turn-helix transcriptional regulator [Limosilactobacillus reuteri]
MNNQIHLSALIKQLNKQLERHKTGFTSAKVQVIAYLFEHQDKVIYQKDLEHIMNLSRPTINGIVKRLIAKGAVKLIPNPNDRRSKQLILSDTTKEEAQKHQKEFENDIRTIEKNLPLVYQPTRLKNSNII